MSFGIVSFSMRKRMREEAYTRNSLVKVRLWAGTSKSTGNFSFKQLNRFSQAVQDSMLYNNFLSFVFFPSMEIYLILFNTQSMRCSNYTHSQSRTFINVHFELIWVSRNDLEILRIQKLRNILLQNTLAAFRYEVSSNHSLDRIDVFHIQIY